VLDPNVLSPDGSLSLAQWKPSPDGRLLAYALSEGGADWQTLHVRDLDKGADLGDQVRWMRFSDISWTKDSKGFFYSRYPEPPKGKVLEAALSGQALYYHRVGAPQSEDRLVYSRPDLPTWFINGSATDDGRYLLVFMYRARTTTTVSTTPISASRTAPGGCTREAAHRGRRCGVRGVRQRGAGAMRCEPIVRLRTRN
jgi:prolyl oligopeptidase